MIKLTRTSVIVASVNDTRIPSTGRTFVLNRMPGVRSNELQTPSIEPRKQNGVCTQVANGGVYDGRLKKLRYMTLRQTVKCVTDMLTNFNAVYTPTIVTHVEGIGVRYAPSATPQKVIYGDGTPFVQKEVLCVSM